MKKLLFINACVNRENSRTNYLSRQLIELLKEKENFEALTELVLEEENIQALNSEALRKRIELSKKGQFDDDMFKYSNQFLDADYVVIGAPYWDLSFPAMLKNYIEATSVVGITFSYGENGIPKGRCKAEKLYYVTTSGGYIRNFNLGYDMIKVLAKLYGVKECKFISAEGLDIITNDAKTIIDETVEKLSKMI